MLLTRVDALDLDALAPLVAESLAGGKTFIERLHDEYVDGTNRFDRPGEALFAVHAGPRMLGVGGLNVDPYNDDPGIGRVRHVYVLVEARGRGVGRRLLDAIVEAARPTFHTLTLRTENPVAARLYRRVGFRDTPRFPTSTHWLTLSPSAAGPP